MNIKISKSVGKTYDNKGSSQKMVNYLEHEDQDKTILEKEHFFSSDKDIVPSNDVIDKLDNNRKKLGRNDAKFFHISISPSIEELEAIGSSSEKLKAYTRTVMNEYAKNFNKGLKGGDLMYYAKIHHTRAYRGTDNAVKEGKAKIGDLKQGNQMHVHIVVSRKDIAGKRKLSPLTNHKSTNKGAVKGGFNREQFIQNTESKFDKMFNYKRDIKQSYLYAKTMKKGTIEEKFALKIKPIEKQELNKGLKI